MSSPGASTPAYASTLGTLMRMPLWSVKEWGMRGYVKKWGMRGYVKECGADTIIDCRKWQREQWDNVRAQRDLEERRRKREQSIEERREWCRRRTCRRRMLAEDVDAPPLPPAVAAAGP